MATNYNQFLVEYSAGSGDTLGYGYWVALGAASRRDAIARFRKKHAHLENLSIEGVWTRFVPEEGEDD